MYATVLAVLLPTLLPGAPLATVRTAPPKVSAAVGRLARVDGLIRHDVMRPRIPAGIPETCEIAVWLDGRPAVLRLHRTSLRDPKAKLHLDRGNGALDEVPLPPHRTYRGIEAATGAPVAASIVDGRLWALVDRPDATWMIQPSSELARGRPAGEHVAYRRDDVVHAGDHRCGNGLFEIGEPDWMQGVPTDPLESGLPQPPGAGDGGDGGVAGANPFIAEIAFDADFEFYQLNGSNATNVVNDVENVMNALSLVYDRDVNMTFEFTGFVVRTTSADPYTTNVMSDLLCEFRNKWNATPESQIPRDLAQLFTGKSISGNVIGLAWLGAACNQNGSTCGSSGSLAYSTVESRFSLNFDFRVSLSAHEIGHNWAAQHCDSASPCHIMCSIVNQCQGTTGANLKFGPTEQSQILNFRNSVGCDVALPPPIPLPFTDNFESGTSINAQRWIYSKGAAISTAAVAEPSPTRSLNLDAIGNLEHGDDEIRSNFVLLAGVQAATLSYWTQHRGVEAGESLVVEYFNSSLDWVTLNTIVSTGTDQTSFAPWQHVLPANARHDRFRLRFRTLVDGADDDWFIDDVSIVDSSTPTNDECAGSIVISTGATAFDTTTATDSASALPIACDDGNGTLPRKDLWYRVLAPCTGRMTVSTCGTAGFNTFVAAYATACPPAGALLGCSDDEIECVGGTSTTSFEVAAGQLVVLRVGGAAGGGTGTLQVSCVETPPCPTDLNGDSVTDASDLASLLAAWGTADGDVDGNATTDATDLAALLAAWGDCG